MRAADQVEKRLRYLRRIKALVDQKPAVQPPDGLPVGVEGLRKWNVEEEDIRPIGRRNDFSRVHERFGPSVNEMLSILTELHAAPAAKVPPTSKPKRPTLAEQLTAARKEIASLEDKLRVRNNQYTEVGYERDTLRAEAASHRDGRSVLAADYEELLAEVEALRDKVAKLEAEARGRPRAPHLHLVDD